MYSAIIFISLTLLDRLLIYPISFKIKSLNEEIKNKESGIKRSLHILALKDKILSESAKYYAFFGNPKSDEEEISFLLKEVENIASKTSVYLLDLKPMESRTMGVFKKYSVSLNCEAQMEQLAHFMYNIESSGKFLTIEKYQISPKAKGSSVAKCGMLIVKLVVP